MRITAIGVRITAINLLFYPYFLIEVPVIHMYTFFFKIFFSILVYPGRLDIVFFAIW